MDKWKPIIREELEVEEEGKVVLPMQVMVGLPFNHTPVFSDTDMAPRIKSLLASAHDIAVEDLLPHVKRDPSYLAQKEMQVFQDWGLEAREVYPDTVN